MKIRFYHAMILTMADVDAVSTVLRDAELHTDGASITYVGSNPPAQGQVFDREIDCRGRLLMPGFKNAHAHGPMTFLRSMADDLPLQEWLQKQVFPAEARLTPEDTYWLQQLAILEYLQGGITSSFEMYFIDEGIRRAALQTGFRTVLCGAACGKDLSWLTRMEQDLIQMDKQGCLNDPLLTFQLGFHAEYSTDRTLLEGIAALAHKYRVPVFTHCQETEQETLACLDRNHKTPLQFLASMGMFDYGGALFHGVFLREGDMACLAEHGIGVVTNPGSNAKLASGIAPLLAYEQQGICLGIGTDGPASNNGLDMFWEMHLAAVLQKLLYRDAQALPAETVLRMAVNGNAAIMGLSDCDSLAVGKKADLILVDLLQPNMQPVRHIAKNLVYSGSRQNVVLTMIHGSIRYENGRYADDFDVSAIYRKCQEITDRIVQA